MITIKNIRKTYKHEVLKRVNLYLEEGKIYCLLGRNGSGKTTLMKILAGIIDFDSGSINYDYKKKIDEVFYYVSESPVFLEFLSGYDNLDFIQKLNNLNMSKIDLDAFIKSQGLDIISNELVVNYSQGMKHQLMLAIAFLISPPVLLLDEPLVSLDPINIISMHEKLRSYAKQGKIVFISTHMLPIAHKIGDELLLLKDGEIHQIENNFSEIELQEYIMDKI